MMNFFREDPQLLSILREYLDEEMLDWAEKELDAFGALCGGEIDRRAVHTDREGQPKLIKYNKYGDDISYVWLNEGYLKTIEQTYQTGIVGYVHKEIPALNRKGNYLYSYAQGYLLSQAEPGFYCPVTLTMATALLIDRYANQELKDKYLPHVLSTGEVEVYEGATFLTERQGGSDVGANETQAIQQDDFYRLHGLKYFASNAGACGVAMVLARREGAPKGTKGLSLFLVPWRNDDGTLNGIQIRRLKDKLGVRAVPSAEVQLEGAEAYLVGEAEKGIYYMMEALNLSRICNAVASIGIMQRAYLEAKKYAYERVTFGSRLADFPMIKATLSEMAVTKEVETSAIFSLIALYDKMMQSSVIDTESEDYALTRLLIALLKMRTAEESIQFAHEAIEMHGGNGYIEDFITPRLLRDAQVLTVWEGTANILGLEVLRLIQKYKVHELFIRHLQEGLSQLPQEMKYYATPIEQGLKKLVVELAYLAKQNEDIQTYHCKALASLMTDLYLSFIALKDASNAGDRKLIIARVFLQKLWKMKEMDREYLSLHYFEQIVNRY